MPDTDTVQAHLDDAIATQREALAGSTEAMLLGWYLISEWTDGNGDRWVSRVGSDKLHRWTRMGYLAFAKNWEEVESTEPQDEDAE